MNQDESNAAPRSEPLDAATKVGVMAVIRGTDGRILLGLKNRAFDSAFVNKWVTPGGRVKFMETLEVAIKREVKEETGLDVEIVTALPPQEIIHDKGHYAFFAYVVTPIGGEEKSGDDISEVRWFSASELDGLEMTPITRQAIENATPVTPGQQTAEGLAASKYVVGFMFNPERTKVALIRKSKPAWQKGKLNGIGGKIEKGESPLQAMIREFEEEAGAVAEWRHYATMSGPDWSVACFATHGELSNLVTKTGEAVEIHDVLINEPQIIENLPWLIALAIDHLEDGRPRLTEIKYP